MNQLEVRNISKHFGKIKAIQNVSFSIPEGSVFGILGRNGAGKTTTIRMLMQIYKPDSGEILLNGKEPDELFKSRVGYLPEERGLYKKMNVWDTLMFFADVKGKKNKATIAKAESYLEKFDLISRKKSKVVDLSKGNQQKIQFISTILHDPEFIILDEPFSGLDPINTNILREIILDLKKQGKMIIFSTHLMDFAERMCDHIAIINQGELRLSGALSDIKKEYNKENVSLVYNGNIDFLQSCSYVKKVENFGNFTGIRLHNASYVQELLKALIEHQVEVKRFDANDISLHEIFIEQVGEHHENEAEGGV